MDIGDQPTLDGNTPSPGGSGYSLPARYEPLEKLGEGGMGVVLKARDRETGETVAVKVLRPEIAADALALERFKNEVRLARRITHKNVCRIHEFHRSETTACITMEYVEGQSLRQALARLEGFSARYALNLCSQMLAGLTEAHANEVVHRDLKPENILIARDGTLKIMDFGIARLANSQLTRPGTMIGTPAYMSPEQAEGKPGDLRCDIYALGLIIYEIFTGVMAIQAETPVAAALKQISGKAKPPRDLEPDIPEHVERVILKCLEKDPSDRYQSAKEVAAALADRSAPRPAGGPAAPPETLATEAQVRAAALPLHLTRWQRSDWLLLAAGLLALPVFVTFAGRVIPWAINPLPMSSEEAVETGRTVLEKFFPETKGSACQAKERDFSNFADDVLSSGLPDMLEDALWSPSWLVACGAYVASFDQRKRVAAIGPYDPREHAPPSDRQPLAAASIATAEKAVQELFGISLQGVAPSTSGPPGSLHWRRAVEGSRARDLIFLRMSGDRLVSAWRLRFAGTSESRNTGERSGPWYRDKAEEIQQWRTTRRLGWVVMYFYCIFCTGLAVLRKAYGRQSAFVWTLSLLATLALMPSMLWTVLAFIPPLFAKVMFAVVIGMICFYGLFAAPFDYLARILPGHLKTMLEAASRPAALGGLRGSLLGCCYVALHVGALVRLGQLKWAAANPEWLSGVGVAPAGVGPLSVVLSGTASTLFFPLLLPWLLVGLPIALLRRASARTPVVLFAVAMLWMAGTASLPGNVYPSLPLYLVCFLQGIFFAWIFLQYDLLTVSVAMLTVDTGLIGYGLFRHYENAEPLWYAAAGLIPWLLVVSAAVLIWFLPQLQTARRRVAAVFE